MHFTIEDQRDGWWHCPEHLSAEVVDGPMSVTDPANEYWLVRVSPDIRWHGDPSYAERWGQDHPLVKPMEATDHALVLVTALESGPAVGIPVCPAQLTDGRWQPVVGLEAKATLTRSVSPDA